MAKPDRLTRQGKGRQDEVAPPQGIRQGSGKKSILCRPLLQNTPSLCEYKICSSVKTVKCLELTNFEQHRMLIRYEIIIRL
jgi:hypothetical protein